MLPYGNNNHSNLSRDLEDVDAGKDYSDIWLEHLNELEIGKFANLKVELKFVKLILAKSPVLKKDMKELMKKNTRSGWGNKFSIMLLPVYYHKDDSDPL
uniref:F-box/FBD/LRR-repeat protein At1g13570-like n=1 Tax=Tanacetum cinerariifolium TaxID=118510 RepID=A0A699I0F0_TANCI|nr:F-box/FBD/LRR-repeat protein At1g13570-like [Tanacetum cinerariifolium]